MSVGHAEITIGRPRDLEVTGIEREAHWRPLVRFLLSLVVAAGATGALWLRVPNDLLGPTDIVGYPIYANFDIYRYTYGYYVIVLLFPALATAIYLGISWRGPLRRLRTPSLPVFPLTTVSDAPAIDAEAVEQDLAEDLDGPAPTVEMVSVGTVATVESVPPDGILSHLRDSFWVGARVALPVAALVLECSIIQTGNRRVSTLAGIGVGVLYVAAVSGSALTTQWSTGGGHSHRRRYPTTWRSEIARANSLFALVTVPLLWFVSRSTEVSLGRGSHIVRYPWLPWWIAAILTIAAFMAWRRGMRKARTLTEKRALESNVLTWIVGPLLLFLVTAVLPGALGTFSAFDDAQYLASPQLIFHHGLLPWRDIYLLHGMLQDVLDSWVGVLAFGNTRWGGNAGIDMFTFPLGWLTLYAFSAYFCKRNRLFLVAVSGLIVGGLFMGVNPRFIPLPLVLILFDLVLRRTTRRWSWLFMGALFVQVILTPEAILFVPCLLVVLLAKELAGQNRRDWSTAGIPRTFSCVVAGLALTIGWMAYLVLTGSVTSFFSYFIVFSSGHVLEGGVPTNWPVYTVSLTTFFWILPSILWLLTFLRVTVKLRLRRPWTTTDWVMVASAAMTLVYFPKALDRADAGHINEAVSVAVPLIVLWLIELLRMGDAASRRLVSSFRRLNPPSFSHTLTALVVLAMAVGASRFPQPLPASLARVASDFHPEVAEASVSSLPRLGYTRPGSVNTKQILDLRSVLDSYAGPTSPVFDYADEPGILYYLLDRVPGTRYYYSAVTQTASAQHQEISDLQSSRPPVVVYTDTAFGLPQYDGIPQALRSFEVTSYLLAHYRPILDVGGQLVMLRDDLRRSQFPTDGGDRSRQLYFASPSCDFGYIPNYSSLPNGLTDQSSVVVPVATPPVSKLASINVSGWAVDPRSGRPYSQIDLVSGGRVVASTTTHVPRPDVSAELGTPLAVNAGFSITASVGAHAEVQVYAITRTGGALQFAPGAPPHQNPVSTSSAASILSSGGQPIAVVGAVQSGHLDTSARTPVDYQKLAFPNGTDLSQYQWLVLHGSLRASSYVLADSINPAPNHSITFKILPTRATTIYVRVGSCLQWHGYDPSHGLYLERRGTTTVPHPSVDLARATTGS